MKLTSLHSGPSLLVLLMAGWVAGLFVVPPRIWLEPFARGSVDRLSGARTLPAADARPGRISLGRIDLSDGRSRLLILEARAGGAIGLQLRNHRGGQVVLTRRLAPRESSARFLLPLDAGELPEEMRLTLWNRGRNAVEIESADLRELAAGYRWAPILYRWSGPLLLVLLAVRYRHRLVLYLRGEWSTSDPGAVRRWDGLTASLLFLLCFTSFRLAPVHQLLDAKYIAAVSHSFLKSGSVALVDDFVPSRRARQAYTLRPVGGKTYHFFSAAPAVLGAPVVALFELSGVSPVAADGRYLGHNEMRILRFTAALLAAALCVLLFRVGRVWLPPGGALALTLVFAFGTQIFSVISRPFWSHAWATLLLAGALLLLVSPRSREGTRTYVLAASLLCWAYFCRPPLSLAIVAVGVWIFFQRRRFFLPFLTTGLLWASLFVTYSIRTYQSLLPPYFLSSHLDSGRLAGGLLLTSYPEAVMGTLISPGRGLLIYVPITLLIAWALVRSWRWVPEKGLAVAALSVCLTHWQLVSVFRNWWGGQSFGPRLMSDLVPWLFVLAALGLASLRAAAAQGAFTWTFRQASVVALIVAASIFIHARGAWVQETQRGAGIWNWRYPQFLAGLLDRPGSAEPPQDDRP